MMTLFCGDTSRCICSFNYAFTSDRQPAAPTDDEDYYNDIILFSITIVLNNNGVDITLMVVIMTMLVMVAMAALSTPDLS